jgi:hypothetical protein
MKQNSKIKLILLSAFALCGAAISASAQDAMKSPQPTNQSLDSGYGLLGTNYYGADFGYVNHTSSSPSIYHDYDAELNQNVHQQGILGVDATVSYDYLKGTGANDLWTRRQQVALGLTGYVIQPWGKPFVSVGTGWDWDRSGGRYSNSYMYNFATGVEFQILRPLVFTPFVSYEATPRLDTNPATALNRFEANYGGKFTYRLDHNWGVSLGASADRDRDLTYKAGVQFHY